MPPSRTRKWSYVEQEAKRLADLGLSNGEIARRLGVNKSTVGRWMSAGKLGAEKENLQERQRSATERTSTERQTPEQWAASVRAEYQLDDTDDQLVTLGEIALATARDPKMAGPARMTAVGRFQAIARQLALVSRKADQQASAPGHQGPETGAPAQRPRNPTVERKVGVDPRGLLTAVSS